MKAVHILIRLRWPIRPRRLVRPRRRLRWVSVIVPLAMLVVAFAVSHAHEGAAPAAQTGGGAQKEPKVARLMRTCNKCHMDVVEEWQGSAHARSWTNPVFQAAIAGREDGGDACARCHAPASLFDTGVGKPPRARSLDRELGIPCMTCHMKGNQYYGPIASKGHKGVVVMTEYRESQWCAGCHGQPELSTHDHHTSYRAGAAAAERRTCQECHMPEVERKMVASKRPIKKHVQPPQKCRKHLFQVELTEAGLAEAAAMAVALDGETLRVTVTPHTGHSLLVEQDRYLGVAVRYLDGEGNPVGEAELREFRHGDDAALLAMQPQTLEFPVPAGAVAAHAELVLVLLPVKGGREEEQTVTLARAAWKR